MPTIMIVCNATIGLGSMKSIIAFAPFKETVTQAKSIDYFVN